MTTHFMVGIDPGTQGAMVSILLNTQKKLAGIWLAKLPYSEKELNIKEFLEAFHFVCPHKVNPPLADLFNWQDHWIAIEQISTFGKTTTQNYVNMGMNVGKMLGCLYEYRTVTKSVRPLDWQKHVMPRKGTNQNKEKTWQSIENFFYSHPAIKNDGLADAALIALSQLIELTPEIKNEFHQYRRIFHVAPESVIRKIRKSRARK